MAHIVRWFYSEGYDYGGGLQGMPREVHGFVLRKPSEIRTELVASGVVDQSGFEAPEPVSEADLVLVHDAALIRDLHDPKAVATAIEFPELAFLPAELVWQAVVQPQLLATGGTCAALRAAAAGEWAINLSGGYHHARRNLSHGFCLINDVAVAVDRLRRESVRKRILIFDLDLHQGDGNASFFANDQEVFTVSVHEEGIFPIPKLRSDIDVGLRSWAADDDYLGAVEAAMEQARERFDPEIIVYVAGSDPYEHDPLGSLQVSADAMRTRDERVARFARDRGCALVALPAGGYSNESPRITAAGFRAIADWRRLNSRTNRLDSSPHVSKGRTSSSNVSTGRFAKEAEWVDVIVTSVRRYAQRLPFDTGESVESRRSFDRGACGSRYLYRLGAELLSRACCGQLPDVSDVAGLDRTNLCRPQCDYS